MTCLIEGVVGEGKGMWWANVCVTVHNGESVCVAWTGRLDCTDVCAWWQGWHLKVGSASGPLTREACLGVDLSFAIISLVLSTRHTPVRWLHTLHYGWQPNLWSMHLEERDSSAPMERLTRIYLRYYLSVGSIPSGPSPTCIRRLHHWRATGCQESKPPQNSNAWWYYQQTC